MLLVATILSLALTRAEIIERFKAPVITQADGLVQVFADCAPDIRREYQLPIARFAAETVKTLYRGLNEKSVRFQKPGVIISIGEVRTNVADVVVRVSTNDDRVVTRLFVPSPGFTDIAKFRTEVIKGFYRAVKRRELSDEDAVAAFLRADPDVRVMEERQRLEDWLQRGKGDDEEGLRLMRKVIRPGMASVRDVLIFASRLYLYPPQQDLFFVGRFPELSFADALRYVTIDPCIRIMAAFKANEMPVFGGGRGVKLQAAADAYRAFLLAMADGEKSPDELSALLKTADERLEEAYKESLEHEKQQNHH